GCADTPPLRGGDAPLQISHFDLFRITDASELEEIGLNHAMANDITLIEWPELAEPMLPADTIHIYLTAEGEGRNLEVVSNK
ncbi:MAG: tRNA (adenosine(37)-N6)-threonylcarbamoyltransferase complex ATPase subunit type 1 TsaE, partial [Proteobacteria bacterium]|nr:tRNA (adenosine(37)-N6)-threonylcarbamoyltransferase complex ATPase subunit type 1 TsaE [Pseudomonadota bacterium]